MNKNKSSSENKNTLKRVFLLSLVDFHFPILSWEEFGFVKPCVHAVLGQAGVESPRTGSRSAWAWHKNTFKGRLLSTDGIADAG